MNGVAAGTFTDYVTEYVSYALPKAAVAAFRVGDNVIASETSQTYGGQFIDWGLAEQQ